MFAAAVVENFSRPGDVVLDPYMGGGTAVVESFFRGRTAIGNDLNSLSEFVVRVKTTPLSDRDQRAVLRWANQEIPSLSYRTPSVELENYLCDQKTWNLSLTRGRFIKKLVAAGLKSTDDVFPDGPANDFVRCAILKTSQWALDGRKTHTALREFRERLASTIRGMLDDLETLDQTKRAKDSLPRVILHNEDATNIPLLRPFARQKCRANLVVTSPPYPGVHVLYHRWQIDGRRESPAPYWIAGCKDGEGASYYNFADRRHGADNHYFESSFQTLKAIRGVMADGAYIVQLLAFGRPESQLPKYLENMKQAGFDEHRPRDQRIWRSVPNRRWHACTRGRTNASKEVVLIHRAC